MKHIVIMLLVISTLLSGIVPSVRGQSAGFADPAFRQLWERTDMLYSLQPAPSREKMIRIAKPVRDPLGGHATSCPGDRGQSVLR